MLSLREQSYKSGKTLQNIKALTAIIKTEIIHLKMCLVEYGGIMVSIGYQKYQDS